MNALLVAVTLAGSGLPARTAPTVPPAGFLDLELCAAVVGGACSVRDFVEFGLDDVRWTRMEPSEGSLGRDTDWRLDGKGRLPGKDETVSMAFELRRGCTGVGGDGETTRPFARIDGWSVSGAVITDAALPDGLLERVSVRRAARAGGPPRAPSANLSRAPPAVILDLELCARYVPGRSCAVREFVAELPGAYKRWVHFTEEAENPARRGGEGWRLIVGYGDADEEPEVQYQFLPDCYAGWPVSTLVKYRDGHVVRPSMDFPEFLELLGVAAREARSWPPSD